MRVKRMTGTITRRSQYGGPRTGDGSAHCLSRKSTPLFARVLLAVCSRFAHALLRCRNHFATYTMIGTDSGQLCCLSGIFIPF